MSEQGRQMAGTATEQGKQVAGTAAEQGKQVAGTAAEGAKQVAGEAKEQVAQVAEQAKQQARSLVGEAKGRLREQAGSQTGRLSEGLHNLAGQVQALSEGRPEEAGAAREYARQAADRVSQWAGRVDERGFEGLVDDLQNFARRRPGVFLFGAAVAGFVVGRLLRGAQGGEEPQARGQFSEGLPAPSPGTRPAPVTLGGPAVAPAPAYEVPPATTEPVIAVTPGQELVDESRLRRSETPYGGTRGL